MRTFAALLLKEEKAIFTSPIAYVVLSVFLVIMGYSVLQAHTERSSSWTDQSCGQAA